MKSIVGNRDIKFDLLISRFILRYKIEREIDMDILNEIKKKIGYYISSNSDIDYLIHVNIPIMNLLYPTLCSSYINADDLNKELRNFRNIYGTLFGDFKGCIPIKFFECLLDSDYVMSYIEDAKEVPEYMKRLYDNYVVLVNFGKTFKQEYLCQALYSFILSNILRYDLINKYDGFMSLLKEVDSDINRFPNLCTDMSTCAAEVPIKFLGH